jgi:flagellar FliJ protein
MAKKGFALEQVLTYRTEMEKVRKQEFATVKAEFEGACERLQNEETRVVCLNTEFLGRQQEGISATELQLYADFFRGKRADLTKQRREVDSLNSRLTEKRDVLVEAARDKKALETLKEKKALVYHREMAEKERAMLEEVALRARGGKR